MWCRAAQPINLSCGAGHPSKAELRRVTDTDSLSLFPASSYTVTAPPKACLSFISLYEVAGSFHFLSFFLSFCTLFFLSSFITITFTFCLSDINQPSQIWWVIRWGQERYGILPRGSFLFVTLLDLLSGLDTGTAIWQRANFPQWSFEVLQPKKTSLCSRISPRDYNTKITAFEAADSATVTCNVITQKSFGCRFLLYGIWVVVFWQDNKNSSDWPNRSFRKSESYLANVRGEHLHLNVLANYY